MNFIPTHKTKKAAGADVKSKHDIVLKPGVVTRVNTGAFVPADLADDHFLQLSVRSSIAEQGVILANGVGVIDGDYDEEIGMLMLNTSPYDYYITKGTRIGQLVAAPYFNYYPQSNENRTGGFGSTGDK